MPVLLLALSTGLVSAAPVVHKSGELTVYPSYLFDIDEGVLTQLGDPYDLWFEANNADRWLSAEHGARIKKWGTSKPSYRQCRDADVTHRRYSRTVIPAGTWVCALTDEGRVSRLKILKFSKDELDIRFTTWETPG
jgi:hypothetical protein